MYARYVAIGDSSTEGLDDPDGAGGWRGWADRLAEHVARTSPGLEYANLAVRGRLAGQVRREQLDRALELRPDLVTAFAGVNDLLRPGYDRAAVLADLEAVLGALTATGATVLTITMPDPSRVMPLVRPLKARVAGFNAGVRGVAARTGARVADVGAHAVGGDPRLWSDDRLHANPLGHERIAAALAATLQLPGTDDSWAQPLPPVLRRPPHELARAEAVWLRTHFTPWVRRRLRGESSGDAVVPKRPEYRPVG